MDLSVCVQFTSCNTLHKFAYQVYSSCFPATARSSSAREIQRRRIRTENMRLGWLRTNPSIGSSTSMISWNIRDSNFSSFGRNFIDAFSNTKQPHTLTTWFNPVALMKNQFWLPNSYGQFNLGLVYFPYIFPMICRRFLRDWKRSTVRILYLYITRITVKGLDKNGFVAIYESFGWRVLCLSSPSVYCSECEDVYFVRRHLSVDAICVCAPEKDVGEGLMAWVSLAARNSDGNVTATITTLTRIFIFAKRWMRNDQIEAEGG